MQIFQIDIFLISSVFALLCAVVVSLKGTGTLPRPTMTQVSLPTYINMRNMKSALCPSIFPCARINQFLNYVFFTRSHIFLCIKQSPHGVTQLVSLLLVKFNFHFSSLMPTCGSASFRRRRRHHQEKIESILSKNVVLQSKLRRGQLSILFLYISCFPVGSISLRMCSVKM